MNFKSCKNMFNRIEDTKKYTILETAMGEFSSKGFNSANINIIAEKSNTSIGAMYKYFDSKRALYLTCVEWSIEHLNKKIEAVLEKNGDMMTILEDLIKAIQLFRQENDSFNKLYYEMATESNAEYAMLISSQVEGVTSNLYAAYIEEAKHNNAIRQEIDSRYFAFFIDNILMMLQFSYSCEYYKNRAKIFTYGDAFEENDNKLREQLMLFIKGALFYSPEN